MAGADAHALYIRVIGPRGDITVRRVAKADGATRDVASGSSLLDFAVDDCNLYWGDSAGIHGRAK